MKVKRVQTEDDLSQAYPCATESPIPFWADGLPLCKEWFAHSLGKYIEGFHLLDENHNVIGHIYWGSSLHALAPYEIEEGVAYVYCEWIQRRHRNKGGMHLLFQEFVEFLKSKGYKGILLRGTEIEVYMHYQHFLKRGFRPLKQSNGSELLYYPLSQASVVVKPIPVRITPESKAPVEILIIGSRLCPVGASAVVAIRKVAKEFGKSVSVKEIPASREVIDKYGVANGIFVNGKVRFFGPVSEAQVRKVIEEELKNKGA